MNRVTKHIGATLLVTALVFIVTTCDILKPGLGPQIDIKDPAVDITSIKNGDYLKGAVTLQGPASDDTGVASVVVAVTINSVTTELPATISGNTWSATIDTVALSGGEKEVDADIEIKVTDRAGKTNNKTIKVSFDNKKPGSPTLTPDEQQLAQREYALTDTSLLEIIFDDGNGIAKTTLTIMHPAATGTTGDPYPDRVIYEDVSKKKKITFAMDGAVGEHKFAKLLLPTISKPMSGGLFEAKYTLVATDLAGNQSDTFTGRLYFNQDGSPVVNISDHTATIDETSDTRFYPNDKTRATPLPGPEWKPNSVKPGDSVKFKILDPDGLDAESETSIKADSLYVILAPVSAISPVHTGTTIYTHDPLTVAGKITYQQRASDFTETATEKNSPFHPKKKPNILTTAMKNTEFPLEQNAPLKFPTLLENSSCMCMPETGLAKSDTCLPPTHSCLSIYLMATLS